MGVDNIFLCSWDEFEDWIRDPIFINFEIDLLFI